MAAALAYYSAFSLTPLLIAIISICSLIWDPSAIEGTLESEIQNIVGSDGARQIKTMLASSRGEEQVGWAKALSFILLFLGATGLVGQLQGAMNDAWQVKPDPEQGGVWNFIEKRILSFGMLCAIAFLLLVSLVINSILAAAGDVIAISIPGLSESLLLGINTIVSFSIISILFATMFKYLPDASIKWSDVAVGALLTSCLFAIGKFAIGMYLGSKNMENTYGAAGSLALIMVWMYYSSIIFLLGTEFTQVWSKIKGSGIQPAKGAVRIVKKTERREAIPA